MPGASRLDGSIGNTQMRCAGICRGRPRRARPRAPAPRRARPRARAASRTSARADAPLSNHDRLEVGPVGPCLDTDAERYLELEGVAHRLGAHLGRKLELFLRNVEENFI